jgi:hypothetical protein
MQAIPFDPASSLDGSLIGSFSLAAPLVLPMVSIQQDAKPADAKP